MSDKSKDEKLKILRERLAQIKQKHNNIIDQEKNDQDINSYELESANKKNSEKRSFNKFKYSILIIFFLFPLFMYIIILIFLQYKIQ